MRPWQAVGAVAVTVAAAGALGSGTTHAAPEAMLTVSLDAKATGGQGGFDIAGTPVRDLYPGATRRIEIAIVNPDRHRLRIQAIEGRLVSASRRGCQPVSSNLELTAYRGQLPRTVAPNSRTRIGFIEVHMPNSVVDACQRAVFGIHFAGKAAWADR